MHAKNTNGPQGNSFDQLQGFRWAHSWLFSGNGIDGYGFPIMGFMR